MIFVRRRRRSAPQSHPWSAVLVQLFPLMVGWPPELRSWIANRSHHSKMDISVVGDRSVALLEGQWRKSFEKYAKCYDFRDFW